MVKAIIHGGMHKSGSSSIQATLFGKTFPNHLYAPWDKPNHSSLFNLLFFNPVEEAVTFQRKRKTREELLKLRAEWMEKLDTAIDTTDREYLVFSGEAFSSPHHSQQSEGLIDYLKSRCENIRVYLYIRPPIAFMHSKFQQSIQSAGRAKVDVQTLWPRYQSRLERMDELVGPGNVELIPYSKQTLIEGDVVKDFISRIGVTLSDDEIVHTNQSLPPAATILLFAQRYLGNGRIFKVKGYKKVNRTMIDALSQIKSAISYHLDPKLLQAVIDENFWELDWMENRLGYPLLDSFPTQGATITCEEDMVALAEQLNDDFVQIIRDMNCADKDKVAAALDGAQTLSASERLLKNIELFEQASGQKD